MKGSGGDGREERVSKSEREEECAKKNEDSNSMLVEHHISGLINTT
jgi:hypothetical protein